MSAAVKILWAFCALHKGRFNSQEQCPFCMKRRPKSTPPTRKENLTTTTKALL